VLLESVVTGPTSQHQPGHWYGVYPALVTDIKDPDGQGRVKVSLPWSPDTSSARYEAWARLSTLMGGSNRGTWFVPDANDEVLLAFEGGDPRRPYVVGSLWNGSDSPPDSMDGGSKNYRKVIRSRNGVKVTLDDTDGQEKLILETPGGQKVTLNASAKITLSASLVEVSAGTVTVNAGMSKFSGVVQADTVISNTVISSAYTPGAGNIW
jgi:uncharacterized protein involved in type VI secretion and phage assembly